MNRFAVVLLSVLFICISVPVLAQEGEAPAPQKAPAVASQIWIDDDLPVNAKTTGTWGWDEKTVVSGKKSHGHPSGKGLQSHGFTADPVSLPATGLVIQQVWLDPADPPKGIMMKFKLTSGEEIGVYWEGEEEVFNPAENEETWYYGLLPELGKWTPLEVFVEDLGMESQQVTGLTFATFGGRVLWDTTTITEAPPAEEMEYFPELSPNALVPSATQPGAQPGVQAGEKPQEKPKS